MPARSSSRDQFDAAACRVWEAILARLRAMHGRKSAGGKTYDDMARLLGVSQGAVVYSWLKGTKGGDGKQSFGDILRYCATLGIDVTAYVGTSPRRRKPAVAACIEERALPFAGRTGMGQEGSLFSGASSSGKDSVLFPVHPRYWKEGRVVLQVDSDSMEPTILRGAYIGVDPLDAAPFREGELYLVQSMTFGRVIKRIFPGEPGRVWLVSDKENYQRIQMDARECEQALLGHVAWILQPPRR